MVALRLVARACVVSVAIASSALAQSGREVNPQAAATKAFADRIAAYVSLHDKARASLPKLQETSNPGEIDAREAALAAAIRDARANARTGDVFGEFAPIAKRLIADDWRRRSAADRKALTSELTRSKPPQVNTAYPRNTPLLTVPSRLLTELPRLPEALEYRIYGRHLILRDTEANIVVDALIDAFPADA